MFASNTSQVSSGGAYIEDVFSTYLWDGTSSTQSINNGIDLSTKGGLVWIKNRNYTYDSVLVDTARGTSAGYLTTSFDYAQSGSTYGVTAFNTNGFTLNSDNAVNQSSRTYVGWTFRKQAKFFDVQTYTGSASAVTINHSLGSTPGCVIIKCTSNPRNWMVWHRSLTNSQYLYLNTSNPVGSLSNWISVSSTQITIQPNASGNPDANYVGRTYVAYIFAHDAGGFGSSGSDNVISCGSYTGTGSDQQITLGWEPQWVLIKSTTYDYGNWSVMDTMRGWSHQNDVRLVLDSNSEGFIIAGQPNATGFIMGGSDADTNQSGQTYIYIAIRRGPMKAPTSGTSVYTGVARSGTSGVTTITTGFSSDVAVFCNREATASSQKRIVDRLRGVSRHLLTQYQNAEGTDTAQITGFLNTSVTVGADTSEWNLNRSGYNYINWFFARAPSFMDIVCWSGNGSANRVISHNLTVTPELVLIKSRTANNSAYVTAGLYSGVANHKDIASEGSLFGASSSINISSFSNPLGGPYVTSKSSTSFTLGSAAAPVNLSGDTYVAYLFASCPGVSKVGSYTGNGSSQTINCGFTGGARFVLIKRTDSSGEWYVWDTARGIVSANDPHLELSSANAETTTNDSVDPDNTGFIVNQVSATNINVSSATYIYLAIA